MTFPLIFAALAFLHEYHISHTMIDYNPENKSLEVTIKIPVHDLEEAFAQFGATGLNIGDELLEDKMVDTYLAEYLTDNFAISINDEELSCDYLGKELSADMHDLWCFLEVPNVGKVSKMERIQVKNTLLTELFDDQANIVQISISEDKKGDLHLGKDQRSDVLNFEEKR